MLSCVLFGLSILYATVTKLLPTRERSDVRSVSFLYNHGTLISLFFIFFFSHLGGVTHIDWDKGCAIF